MVLAASAGTRSTPSCNGRLMCIPRPEFMATAGFDVSWGGNGDRRSGRFDRTCIRLCWTRPGLRRSAEIEHERFAAVRDHRRTQHDDAWTGGAERRPDATSFNWGFTLQYSLPYFNSHVAGIDNDVPETPHPDRRIRVFNANCQCGIGDRGERPEPSNPASSTMSDKWQIALEAMVPVNAAKRSRRRRRGQPRSLPRRHLPDTLGKPIFPHGLGLPRNSQESDHAHFLLTIAASLAFRAYLRAPGFRSCPA